MDEIEGESSDGGRATSGNGEGYDEAKQAMDQESTAGRHKVYPDVADDAKSIRHPYTNQNPTQFDFDGAELVLNLINHKNFLSEGQYPPSLAEITKMKNLPYREGISPLTHNPRKHREGTTCLHTTKRNLRDLEGEGKISVASNDEKGHLPVFQDPGGASQHKKMGYKSMMDRRTVPWINPREQDLTKTAMEAEEDNATTVGRQMWLHGPPDLFWKMFPPLEIDKPLMS